MYLHISFSDGSNPFLMYGELDKLWKELKKWTKLYRLHVDVTDNIEVLAVRRYEK